MSDNNIDSFKGAGGVFIWFTGVIEDINDPQEMGRVRVRCFGFHTDDKQAIPTNSLPWALVMTPITSAGMSGIGRSATGVLPGSWVIGFFRDGPSAQDPIVMGTVPSQTVGRSIHKGFTDPAGLHPRVPGAIDTPPPAASSLYKNDRLFITKTDLRQTKIETAIPPKVSSVAIDESDSYYERKTWDNWDVDKVVKPVYPQNHVWETISGHVLEVDDTPGHERISVFHKSGTNHEIKSNGDQATVVVADRYTVVFGTDNIYIKGAVNLTIDGDIKTLVKGSYHLEVEGNMTENIKGSKQVKIGNSFQTEVDQEVATNIKENSKTLIGGTRDLVVTKDNTENYGSNHSHSVLGKFDQTIFGSKNEFVLSHNSTACGATLAIIASGEIQIQTQDKVGVIAQKSILIQSETSSGTFISNGAIAVESTSSTALLKASGVVTVSGHPINLN
jgi:hypothetical protein